MTFVIGGLIIFSVFFPNVERHERALARSVGALVRISSCLFASGLVKE